MPDQTDSLPDILEEKLRQLSTDEIRELAKSQWEGRQDQLALKEYVNQVARNSGISIPDSENVTETILPLFDDLDPKQIRQLARDWLRDYYLPFAHLYGEEQKMLARNWLQILYRTDFFQFETGMSSSSDSRLKLRDHFRLTGLSYLLGTEQYQQITDEVEREIQDQVGAKAWTVFREGSQEDWTQYQLQIDDSIRREVIPEAVRILAWSILENSLIDHVSGTLKQNGILPFIQKQAGSVFVTMAL